MRSANRSSTNALVATAASVAAVVGAAVLLLTDRAGVALVVALAAAAMTGGAAAAFVRRERHRHEAREEELSAQANFLESLVEAIRTIAATIEEDEILERTRREAERLFDARAEVVPSGADDRIGRAQHAILLPFRVREREAAALWLTRSRPFEHADAIRARVLVDLAARAIENARLLSEAQVREAERARLSDQLVTAEQDERRRLALFLHDTSLQSLSGIALMLDAGLHAIRDGDLEHAQTVIKAALERHRTTIGSLRDLSFNLEPVVLRDQGFAPAVRALAEEVGLRNRIQIDVDVDAGETLAEQAQASLYQIIREALNQAVRRGPPTRIGVRLRQLDDGGIEAVVSDDAPGERRRRTFEAIEERARTLSGRLEVEQGEGAGTAVRIVLPPNAARG